VDIEQFEQVVSQFLAGQQRPEGNTVLSLDGKTLRATIPAGQSHGLHLLAAYLPGDGLVLVQVEVGSWENEIPAAMRVVKCIDMRGKIVTGDALLAQRELSAEIVEGGGEYLWKVKQNQGQLLQDIEDLFAPESCVPGFSPCHKDFQSATTHDKGHGRIETRKLTASSMLNEFVNWPYVEQVFRLERRFIRVRDGKVMSEISYGVTSLSAEEADAARLLEIARDHWGIENGLHYRRDETLREDRCRLKGQGAQAMAAINNLILGLLLPRGVRNVPDARRYYAANLLDAVRLVLRAPA
jgi:predicted transposase YbfD/YdcC